MNCNTCEVDKNCELQDVANDLGISDHRYNNPKQHVIVSCYFWFKPSSAHC